MGVAPIPGAGASVLLAVMQARIVAIANVPPGGINSNAALSSAVAVMIIPHWQ